MISFKVSLVVRLQVSETINLFKSWWFLSVSVLCVCMQDGGQEIRQYIADGDDGCYSTILITMLLLLGEEP
jgi:hypothetical protein